MTTKNIEIIPIEQSSFDSNIHHLKSQSMAKNTSSMVLKGRRTSNMSITYDASTAHKIRIAKYTLFLLFLL